MRRAVALLLLVAACSGIHAREQVLMPAMSMAYTTTIQPQVTRGIENQRDSGLIDVMTARAMFDLSDNMAKALDSGDRTSLIGVDWATLRQLATSGIQHRLEREEVGAGVALSLLETLNQFSQRYAQLLAR
jgi:hypothetical protein